MPIIISGQLGAGTVDVSDARITSVTTPFGWNWYLNCSLSRLKVLLGKFS